MIGKGKEDRDIERYITQPKNKRRLHHKLRSTLEQGLIHLVQYQINSAHAVSCELHTGSNAVRIISNWVRYTKGGTMKTYLKNINLKIFSMKTGS